MNLAGLRVSCNSAVWTKTKTGSRDVRIGTLRFFGAGFRSKCALHGSLKVVCQVKIL